MMILMINTVPTEKNGITGVIMNILRTIDQRDLHFDLVCVNKPDDFYYEFFKSIGGNIYIIPRNVKKPYAYLRDLIKIIKKNNYEIIHAHGNSRTLALEMLAAKIGGCRIRIAHSHSTSCLYKSMHYLLTPLFKLLCNERIACGPEAGKWLYGNSSFKIINNGINLEKFKYSRKSREKIRSIMSLSEKDFLIGHVGDFHTDNKNQVFLIEMMKSLHELDKRYKLILIGDGQLRMHLSEVVSEYGLSDYVMFTGSVDNVNEYMSAMDLFVLPSIFEGIPLTVIEAQGNGLDCVLSDTISTSVNLTNKVHYLSIHKGTYSWIDYIKNFKLNPNRENASDENCNMIRSAGFDLIEECNKLRQIYLEVVGVEK